MANAFDDVINHVRAAISSPVQTMNTWLQTNGYISPQTVSANGVTYGPAVTRVSRTPIRFVNGFSGEPNLQGRYDNGRIVVAPQKALNYYGDNAGVSDVVKHESMHALMDQMPVSDQYAVAQSPANYSTIAPVVSMGFNGDPRDEVPAQMAQQTHSLVVPQQRDKYLSSFMDTLQAHDPSLAGKISQLLGGVRTPPSGQ